MRLQNRQKARNIESCDQLKRFAVCAVGLIVLIREIAAHDGIGRIRSDRARDRVTATAAKREIRIATDGDCALSIGIVLRFVS